MSETHKVENSSTNKRTSFKLLFSILGITAIISSMFGGYLYFQSNLGEDNKDKTALAANVLSTAFNPSDCGTYTTNGGINSGGVCSVKLYEKSGQLYKQIDVTSGEVVKTRLYYNNTNTSSATNVNLADTKPNGFSLVGNITNNYVDAAPVTLNNNIFTGNNLSVAPGAGYFGYPTDNTATTSNLELGRKKYLTYEAIGFSNNSTGYGCALYSSVTNGGNGGINPFGNTDIGAGTNGCIYRNSWDLTGKKYLTYESVGFSNPSSSYGCAVYAGGLVINGTPSHNPFGNTDIGAGTSGCSYRNSWDMTGKRYLTYETVAFTNSSSTSGCAVYAGGLTINGTPSNNPFGNTIQDATSGNSCGIKKSWDSSDTSRSYGYIGYSTQVPTGIAPGTIYGSTASISGNGPSGAIAATHSGSNTITVTAVPTPNISYNKLYSVDGGTTWSPTVNVNPGQSVLVRLWNENIGGIAATAANIKDSLPATFTYVTGSTKNCLNPSTTNITTPDNTELVCDTGNATNKDTLFQTLTNASGVSPSAGLYDGAGTSIATGGTAYNATSGTKEIGKVKYYHLFQCQYASPSRGANSYINTIREGISFGQNPIASNNISEALNCPPGGTVPSLGFNSTLNPIQSKAMASPVNLVGNRYLNFFACNYYPGPTDPTGIYYYLHSTSSGLSIGQDPTASNSPTATLNCGAGGAGGSLYAPSSFTMQQGLDTLGKRYINLFNCQYYDGATGVGFNIFTKRPSTTFGQDPVAGNNPNPAVSCPTGTAQYPLNTASGTSYAQTPSSDLLDASRSKSYIQYEMIIPSGTAGGDYGTSSTIGSTATIPEFTSITSGTNGTGITVTGDPAFSVKKLLALPTSGTGASAVCPASTSAYSTTLSNTPAGSTICVRLAYQNKTSGAVNNAAITDTLSSGFTYIDASTSNCLTPTTGSELCASDAAQANTNWTGNNGWTGSNFALSPHSGFYGQSATAPTATMEMGKKRYINLNQCAYTSGNDELISVVNNATNPTGIAGTNDSNTAQSSVSCQPGAGGYSTFAPTLSGVKILDSLGKKYLNINQCTYAAATNFIFSVIDTATNPTGIAGTNVSNTAQSSVSCQPGAGGYTLQATSLSGVKSMDTLGNRYFNLNQCTYTSGTNFIVSVIDTATNPTGIAGTNVSNTAQSSVSCQPGAGGYQTFAPSLSAVQTLDLLDPTNGAGYIQYKMTATPASNSSTLTLPDATISGDNQTTVTSNAIINFNSTPLTPSDIPGLTVVCGTTSGSVTSAPVNSTTTCTFPLPSNKTLPSDFKLTIGTGTIDAGGSTPNQSCTVISNIVTCTNVPTGNSIGNIPIFGNLGSGGSATKTATGESVMITGSNFGNINWIFNPDQGSTSPLFRSQDNTSITVNNFRTIFDPTPSNNTRYTCTLEYRNFNDRLTSTPTWTPLNTTPINYTTTSGTTQGCTVNLTKTQRANILNHSLRLTITDTTITNPSTSNPNTYIFYNEYIFRFQGAGVASGG